jgi:dUTP pyrophosphatase
MIVPRAAYNEKLIDPYIMNHETPQGYDLSVGKIESFQGSGILGKVGKILPVYQEVDKFPTTEGESYWLKPGAYLVTFKETVRIPYDMCAFVWSRSSLLRMGAGFVTAVWDAGYYGIGQSMLVVHNPMGVQVPVDGRVAQMVFFRMESETDSPYDGQYQGEGL